MKNIFKFLIVSLTAMSLSVANAGELSISGDVKASYSVTSGDGTAGGVNTNPGLGISNEFSLKASGELDNGTTFTVGTATLDSQAGLTSGYITITTPSFGSFLMGHSDGSAAYKYDEEVPQVYEQLSDVSAMVSANKVGDFMDNNHINYTSPA